MPGDSLRILIVDDHPAIRQALSGQIEKQPGMVVCGEVGSVAEAMERLDRLRPDVVIVDLSLPDEPGLGLVERIRKEYPETRSIVFSMHDERVYAERALQAGALAYVMKLQPTTAVIEALKTVAGGSVYLSQEITSRLLTRFIRGRTSHTHDGLRELTVREIEVFRMLADGLNTEEIAGRMRITRKVVEQNRRAIKEKLGLSSIEALTQYAAKWKLEGVGLDRPIS